MPQQSNSKLVYYVLGAAAIIYAGVTLTSGGNPAANTGKRTSVSAGLSTKASSDGLIFWLKTGAVISSRGGRTNRRVALYQRIFLEQRKSPPVC